MVSLILLLVLESSQLFVPLLVLHRDLLHLLHSLAIPVYQRVVTREAIRTIYVGHFDLRGECEFRQGLGVLGLFVVLSKPGLEHSF